MKAVEIELEPGDIKRIEMDFARHLEFLWYPGKSYVIGSYVVPTAEKSLMFRCTADGVSGRREPRWAKTVGGVTTDGYGSLSWTAEDYGADAYDAISSISIPDHANVTVADETYAGTVVTATFTAGSIEGIYTLEAVITTVAGERKTVDVRVKVKD